MGHALHDHSAGRAACGKVGEVRNLLRAADVGADFAEHQLQHMVDSCRTLPHRRRGRLPRMEIPRINGPLRQDMEVHKGSYAGFLKLPCDGREMAFLRFDRNHLGHILAHGGGDNVGYPSP